MIFDYATQYAYKTKSIAAPEDFEFSDEDFENFKAYVKSKEGFEYETKSHEKLVELEKTIKAEGYDIKDNIIIDQDIETLRNNKDYRKILAIAD